MVEVYAKQLKSLREKSIGLIGRNSPDAIFFKTRFGIHTFFMKFKIDIVILDKQNRVVAFKKNLKPNRVFVWNPYFDKVLELPEGFTNSNKITLGTKVNLSLH